MTTPAIVRELQTTLVMLGAAQRHANADTKHWIGLASEKLYGLMRKMETEPRFTALDQFVTEKMRNAGAL